MNSVDSQCRLIMALEKAHARESVFSKIEEWKIPEIYSLSRTFSPDAKAEFKKSLLELLKAEILGAEPEVFDAIRTRLYYLTQNETSFDDVDERCVIVAMNARRDCVKSARRIERMLLGEWERNEDGVWCRDSVMLSRDFGTHRPFPSFYLRFSSVSSAFDVSILFAIDVSSYLMYTHVEDYELHYERFLMLTDAFVEFVLGTEDLALKEKNNLK